MNEKKNTVIVSAPGKLMLFGEHAVVYGRPCIVTAVDQRIRLKMQRIKNYQLRIKALDVGVEKYIIDLSKIEKAKENLKKEVAFIEAAVRIWKDRYGLKTGVSIETHSDFSSKFGFGSSSAVTVCIVKALAILNAEKLNKKELFDLCYKIVLEVQRKGSGFDLAAAIYGGTIYFQKKDLGFEIQDLRIYDSQLPLIVGYTGVKADTITLINRVAKLKAKNEKEIDDVFDTIAKIADQAKKDLAQKNWETLGELMNENQNLLEKLGVSSDILRNLIQASKTAGAYGAKLSGAGGGDCMICISERGKKQKVKNAISKEGGQVLDVSFNAEGVRVEK